MCMDSSVCWALNEGHVAEDVGRQGLSSVFRIGMTGNIVICLDKQLKHSLSQIFSLNKWDILIHIQIVSFRKY